MTNTGTQLQEFTPFMQEMLTELGGVGKPTVVEVGTDGLLTLARKLSGLCSRYVALTLPRDVNQARGTFEFIERPGLELVGANAMQLSEVVPEADMVLLHNVVLQKEDDDIAKMWAIRRGKIEPTQAEIDDLNGNFRTAIPDGFSEFSRVASSGLIVDFGRSFEGEPSLAEILVGAGVCSSAQVSEVPMLYDDGLAREDNWLTTIVDLRN